MSPLHRLLQDLSFSRRGIWRSCGFLLLLGMGVAGLTGLLLRFLPSPTPPPPDRIERIYDRFLMATAYSHYAELFLSGEEAPDPFVDPLFQSPSDSWLPELREQAGTASPEPGLRFALALWERHLGNLDQAVRLFHAENLDAPHPLVRRTELDTLLQSRDLEGLNARRENPAYAEELHPGYFFRMGVNTQNWPLILRWFWAAEYSGTRPEILFLSLVAGLIWGGLILSLLPQSLHARTLGLGVLACALGWMSTWPTIWSGIWLDHEFSLKTGDDFVSALLYFLVSVGLREEICKVLLFLPFLWWVRKEGRDLEALIFGALVGLGFAVEENINYFAGHQGSGVVVSRFVSANLLHLTLTGVNALALTRAVRDPARWTAEAVQILALTIGLHGLYNTLLSFPVPGLGDLSYFSGTALAGCAWLFFREVHELSTGRGLRISRTALFCWGFCFLFNLELLTAVAWYPFSEALYLCGQAALSAVFIGYIFVHQIREPLAP